ncbi:MAG: efflux RND transporter permease subunit [candidate division Zixibacteria bacterium]|nr:efflux RND transporter permease subunit [Candidatus Tariuqbacter arcticus]
MLNRIIQFSLDNKLIVGLFFITVLGIGIWSYSHISVNAFPDISPVQVSIYAEAHGMAPEEVERLITFPIEAAMNGLPNVTEIRSTSAFGMAVIYVNFKESTDIYFARQLVSERLNAALAELPEMHEQPKLGPISTGLGQVFMYYLTADSTVVTEGIPLDIYLRTINDWVVKYQLRTIPGITDVLSMGGNVLQYQVWVDPMKLIAYDLALNDVVEAIEDNNRNVGAQFIVRGREEYLVRGVGLITNTDQLSKIKIKEHNGTVVHLDDVAKVQIGPEVRRGVVLKDGTGEVVTGIVLKLYGENTSKVIKDLYEKVEEVQKSLPGGVHLIPFYEQANLVDRATGTVKSALLQGAMLVILVLFLFLGNIRSALVVIMSFPIAILTAFIMMKLFNLSADLMSLGGLAIAIGMMVDSSIVMVENIWRHLQENKDGVPIKDLIKSAAMEVARPIAFATTIIIVVFFPLFTLQGVEGKMFSPMSFSITFALLGALIFTFTLVPMLTSVLLKSHSLKNKESFIAKVLKNIYTPILKWALKNKPLVLSISVTALIISIVIIPFLGTEFIPTLEEGMIQIRVDSAPSTSLEEMTTIMEIFQEKITKYSEVTYVLTRIGRPEAGSHPHPVNSAEIMVGLLPYDEWDKGRSKQDLIDDIREDLEMYPGIQIVIAQPIQNMFDELLSGVKAELAVKLYGEDLNLLRNLGNEVKEEMSQVEGITDLSVEQSFGQPQIVIEVDPKKAGRLGLSTNDILEVVEIGIGGEIFGQIYEKNRRFGILVRLDEKYRNDIEAISNIMIHSEDGVLVPLSSVAAIKETIGPIQVTRENNQRRIAIQSNIEGRDMGSVVKELKKRIDENVDLPPGYFIEYGGQFENQQRAMTRLGIIVPITMLIIFLLLYSAFGSFKSAVLIYLNIPFALIGGVFALFISGQYLSVPASVGFIALFGVAVQNGVVLVSYFNKLYLRDIVLEKVILEGALLRLNPVIMTALTTMLGLTPLVLSQGIGSEVQRPLATVVIGGLITSTLLTLVILPVLYKWFVPGKNTVDNK